MKTLEGIWINKELDRMNRELDGCDWCCGGGDERRAYLLERLRQIGMKRESGVYGWYGIIEKWELES